MSGKRNISRFIDANVARKLGNIKYFNAQQIAAADHVIALLHIRGKRKLRDAIIGFRHDYAHWLGRSLGADGDFCC